MVLVILVVMVLVLASTILRSASLTPPLGSSVRLFLMVIVGITLGVGDCFGSTLVETRNDEVGVALGVGVAMGVGVVKESTSSSLGETTSCLVISLGRVFFERK